LAYYAIDEENEKKNLKKLENDYLSEKKEINFEEKFLKIIDEKEENYFSIIFLGPLTNVANVIKKNENFLKKIKRIIIMGGYIKKVPHTFNTNKVSEWNFYFDPIAAKIFFDTVKKLNLKEKVTLYGLDVANIFAFNEEIQNNFIKKIELQKIEDKITINNTPVYKLKKILFNLFKKILESSTFDAITCTSIIKPQIFENFFKKIKIIINITKPKEGEVLIDENGAEINVCLDKDLEQYRQFIFSNINYKFLD
jgi:inosine-uridine nucleoside N-ribohydrolase